MASYSGTRRLPPSTLRLPTRYPVSCGASSVIPRRDPGLDGLREYAFKHQILHQVTYDTVLKRTRRGMPRWRHGSRARAVCSPAPSSAPRRTTDEKAGDHDAPPNTSRAPPSTPRERYAHQGGRSSNVARAIALVDAAAHCDREQPIGSSGSAGGSSTSARRCSILRGQRDEQRADNRRAAGAAADASTTIARVRGRLAAEPAGDATADHWTQESAARQAMEIRQGGPEWRTAIDARSRCLRSRSPTSGDLGRRQGAGAGGLAAARIARARALRVAFSERPFHRREHAGRHVLGGRGEPPATADRPRLGEPRDGAITLGNLGTSLMSLGEHAKARQRYLEEGLRLARAVGDRDAGSCRSACSLRVRSARGTPCGPWNMRGRGSTARPRCRTRPSRCSRPVLSRMPARAGRRRGGGCVLRVCADHRGIDRKRHAVRRDRRSSAGGAGGGRPARAMTNVERVLAHAEAAARWRHRVIHLIRLTCYRVLEHVGDPRPRRCSTARMPTC
mgnify:CR=1 FL=1